MASTRSKRTPKARLAVPQDTETPLKAVETSFGTALYLYARSGDSVDAETIGQDYITFCYDDGDLAFAVCDGVGQSFLGDLAARILGEGLLDWLWEASRPASAEKFGQEVTQALDKLTATSARQVQNFQLPEGLPGILVQALENQRQYGSESMFVAGRLALGNPDPWIGLCWLGDSPVAAVDIDGKLIDLGPKGHTSERWNATTGVKGEIHAWVGGAKNVARVAGYTDGLGLSHAPTDAELARLMQEWQKTPPADDASLFDVRLAPSPATVGEGTSQPTFAADQTRPIALPEAERTPVKALKPLDQIPAGRSTVESWRPISEKRAKAKKSQPPGTDDTLLEGLSTQQQIRVWQQAALLGLTSAALAMLMLERLIAEQDSQDSEEGKQAD